MTPHQPGILNAIPQHARYLTFSIKPGSNPKSSLIRLAKYADGKRIVVGLGRPLIEAVDASVPNLGTFPAYSAKNIEVPSSPAALWCWLRGDDRGDLVNQSRELQKLLADDFEYIHVIDAFKHGSGRDLSGYEDGTENPDGEEAVTTAFVRNAGHGLDGSSYVAVQAWVHNLQHFKTLPQDEQDRTIGRRLSDNEELDDAPPPPTPNVPNRKVSNRKPLFCAAQCPGQMHVQKALISWPSEKTSTHSKLNWPEWLAKKMESQIPFLIFQTQSVEAIFGAPLYQVAKSTFQH
jgi:Dyp-type peroxidase family